MSQMMAIDVSAATEVAAPRIVRRAPTNTNPLDLTHAERKTLADINILFVGNVQKIDRQIAELTQSDQAPDNIKTSKLNKLRRERIPGLLNTSYSTIHQVRATYAAIIGIEAILSNNLNAVLQSAVMGLEEIDEIQGISPYIFPKSDGAHRNIASDERAKLIEVSMRLGKSARPDNNGDVDKALCLRAFVCAAVAAERGLIHIAKENYGAIIRTLHRETCELRDQVAWTDTLCNYARRHANSKVKQP